MGVSNSHHEESMRSHKSGNLDRDFGLNPFSKKS